MTASFWTAAGKSVGFVVPLVIASVYGAGTETDAFFFAFAALNVLISVAGLSAQPVIVGSLVRIRAQGGDPERLIRNLLGLMSAVALGLWTVVMLFLYSGSGLSALPRALDAPLAAALFAAGLPMLVFAAWGHILTAALSADKRFAAAAAAPGLRSLCVIGAVLAFNAYGIGSVLFGYITGECAALVFLVLALKKKRSRFRFRPGLGWDADTADFFRSHAFQMTAAVLFTLNPLIDRWMITRCGPGSVSQLQYVEVMYFVFFGLLSAGWAAILPVYAAESRQMPGTAALRGRIHRALIYSLATTLPACLAASWFSPAITQLIFSRGAMAEGQAAGLAPFFSVYILTLWPSTALIVLQRCFAATDRTRLLAAAAVVRVILNICLNELFVRRWGAMGIYASSVVHTALTAGLLYLIFRLDRPADTGSAADAAGPDGNGAR
ncbi:MAG: polysaccharide biosynthesis C-terminal domain-containing protein [Candidatus Omnitrophica bacterium]|nr:polysaccharide biosynthesis C-terminal domain-containing protein [Candidatus Omnitrophota bacterium]